MLTKDVIDIFRISAPVVKQEFIRKSQTETNTCHKIQIQKFYCQSCLFWLRHFAAQCSRRFHSKKLIIEDEYVPATLFRIQQSDFPIMFFFRLRRFAVQ